MGSRDLGGSTKKSLESPETASMVNTAVKTKRSCLKQEQWQKLAMRFSFELILNLVNDAPTHVLTHKYAQTYIIHTHKKCKNK